MIFTLYSSLPLLPEEAGGVWQAAQAHVDEIHQTDDTKLVGSAANSRDNPNCDYQAGCPERTACNHMVTCLIAGLPSVDKHSFSIALPL